ncbi:molybdenum cofactor biosynthesis protein B [Marinobacterium zhoushanense]|uniref:Molybdenum cofactor biosynthesis protein B n=1 Tax=Marinobacterium zhoushanense TaxID=1679163 RepID=A0ABQ1KK55_9GAMM|nr:molybdenum cofactor biosynthesis protein B [Marinobacterium zhoushanense]GGB99310.1 molybdenum cofactor biosynthesis protein B [Marinobacterium zhoushanense]
MGHAKENAVFVPLNIAVLTVSDTRTRDTDSSGDTLHAALEETGHRLADRQIRPDDIYQLRAQVSQWIADAAVQVILVTGGTGFTPRDNTPEALLPLFDKQIEGYGELFRQLSYEEIGTSTIQSRAVAGVANRTVIFAMPGSPKACRTAWERVIREQLDARHRPCNFVEMVLPDAVSACGPRS